MDFIKKKAKITRKERGRDEQTTEKDMTLVRSMQSTIIFIRLHQVQCIFQAYVQATHSNLTIYSRAFPETYNRAQDYALIWCVCVCVCYRLGWLLHLSLSNIHPRKNGTHFSTVMQLYVECAHENTVIVCIVLFIL